MKNSRIHIPILTRVEGEGALELGIVASQIKSLQLRIYEPPRLFEKLLQQRHYEEVIDIVARICGICPVAYQMSAAQALENALGFSCSPWVQAMRRVFYCGEWLESHSLHIHLLAAPDFLGYHSAIEMAKDYPREVQRGLKLQQLGNAIIRLFGGRSVHPVGARVGGFYQAPSQQKVADLVNQLQAAIRDAQALVHWAATLPIPDNSHEFTSVALCHPHEYPMMSGDIVSDRGLRITIDEFDHYFQEQQVTHSTALHCLLEGDTYLVGPLARLNINQAKLPEPVKQLIKAIGFSLPSKNMFYSLLARAIEMYFALLEAIEILSQYSLPDAPYQSHAVQAGAGAGCSEAPRGLLWHHYQISSQGLIETARIVPPTSQNQARIEEDLRCSLEFFGLEKKDEALRSYAEQIIRNYDPCISCATHFLKLQVKRQ
jgi:coenzyme F420-reducing hydrogenase alpha subunit